MSVEPAQHLVVVDGARRVVRVDDHDRLGAVGDLALDVGEVRHPVGLLVAAVVHGRAAGQRDRRPSTAGSPAPGPAPRRRRRAAPASTSGSARRRRCRGRRPRRRARCPWSGSAASPRGGRRAGPSRRRSRARRRALRSMSSRISGGHSKPNGRRVAGVELEDAVTRRLQPHRLLEHRAPDLVADVGELR